MVIEPEVTAAADQETVSTGSDVTITATAIRTVGTVSFQWEQTNDGGETVTASTLTGSDTDTLTFTANAETLSYSYRCAVTDDNGTWYSNWVTVQSSTIEIDGVVYEPLAGMENAVAVTGYTGSAASLVIPTTVTNDGVTYTVKEIAQEAFYNNTTLTSISLPNTITAIRTRAFAGCTSLSNMTNHD